MAIYILISKVHRVILEVQKPQENSFICQLNAASLLWYPFSKAGLPMRKLPHSIDLWLSEEPKSGMRILWAAEHLLQSTQKAQSYLSMHTHAQKYLCWIKGTIFKHCSSLFFHPTLLLFFHQQTQHTIKSPLLPRTGSQWCWRSEQYLLSCQKDVAVFWDRLLCASKCQTWMFPSPGHIL